MSDNQKLTEKQEWHKRNPVLVITLKFTAVILPLLIFVGYLDSQRRFDPPNLGNHTLRKWDAYYDFTKRQNVDVLLVGNSHLYTGINPKTFSCALGLNGFMLASPGTKVSDYYYVLEEALEEANAKLVVIETFGIEAIDQYSFEKYALFDQLKSFHARRNKRLKLASTPFLFAPKYYHYAWSNTMRNHDYLYRDYEQLEKNKEKERKRRAQRQSKLYLGRYVRFTSGLEDSTIAKYKTLGARSEGLDYEINDAACKYVKKIIDLCESRGIQLVFLTLPMYKDHVGNWPTWKSKLAGSLGEYAGENYWLDLQEGEGYAGFGPIAFENTLARNQHMTYQGSMLATAKLVDFIQKQDRIKLPDRRADFAWRNTFYGDEGFFEYNTPNANDPANVILYKSQGNDLVQEVLHLRRKDAGRLIVRVKNDSPSEPLYTRRLVVKLTLLTQGANGQQQQIQIDVPYDLSHSTSKTLLFQLNIVPLNITKVQQAEVLKL